MKNKMTKNVLNPEALLNIMEDLEEAKKKAEESEEKFKDLLENANDLIQSVDSNGKFNYVNKKWLRTLGYTKEEVEKLRLWGILRKDQIPHCRKIFKKICSGKAVEHVETVFVAKNGKEILVEGNANAQFIDSKFVATRGIFRDITKRKQAEEKLLKLKEKCEKEIKELKKKLKKKK